MHLRPDEELFMNTISLTSQTYQWLDRRARKEARTPDQLADELLREQLTPQHAYIDVVNRIGGVRAMIRGSRVAVSDIVGYVQVGETPESIAQDVLPHLSLAQIYDALSYYHDHHDEIEAELAANDEHMARAYLRERLGEDGYQIITGQKP
jgi:uncharacterized protein (DUF433 family)